MDPIQEQFERSVGEEFFEWFNKKYHTDYFYVGRPDEAPDLHYSSSDRKDIFVEITGAYYDAKHSTFLWKSIRGVKNAPDSWAGAEPNKKLANDIRECIKIKSNKRYGSNTILLVVVPPGVTTAEDLKVLLENNISILNSPFMGIYAAGTFPITKLSKGGYRVITIKKLEKY